jgi:teichuronic acid exporter
VRKSYWRDVLWQASGNTLAQIVGVLGIPLLTRLYAPEDFALQSLFVQLVSATAVLITLRYETLIQLPKSSLEAKGIHHFILVLGMILSLSFALIAWYFRTEIAELVGNRAIAEWLPLAPISAFMVSWAQSSQNILQREGDFKASGISELVSKISYVGSGFIGYLLTAGPIGLLLTTASGALGKIAYLRSQRLSQRTPDSQLGPGHQLPGPFWNVITRYGKISSSLVASGLLTIYSTAAPIIATSRLYGSEALGHLSLVTMTLYLPAGIIGAAIGQVYYQRSAAAWSNGEDIHTLWKSTTTKLATLGVPLYILVATLSPVAYPIVFGAEWAKAGEIAVWMSLPACASLISSPTDRTCLIVGAWWYPISWHSFRALSATLVVYLAQKNNWNFDQFVVALALQLTISYMIDLAAEFIFAGIKR